MKDLNFTIKTFIRAMLLVSFVVGLGACSKSKSGKSANLRDRRTSVNGGGSVQNSVNTSGCSNCGWIYSQSGYDMTNLAADLLNLDRATSDLGSVSGRLGDQTGIVFSGSVTANASSGNIKITVWDSVATQSGQAYVFDMQLDPAASYSSQSNARLVFYDSYGTVTLDGQFTNQYYGFNGTITFQNSDGYSQTLGQFTTTLCGFIRCDGQ